MRENERARKSDGDEEESRAENWRKRKGSSFWVESKVFEVGVEERKGKPLVFIVKSKRGFVMGPSRAGECKASSGGSVPVHQGRERRKMGKGMEGKGEKLLSSARRQ